MILFLPESALTQEIPKPICSADTSRSFATLTAASASSTICFPARGMLILKIPSLSSTVHSLPHKPRLTTLVGCTAFFSSKPYVTGFLPFTSSMLARRSSSPHTTTLPSGFICSKISVFALSTPSSEPNVSRWHALILVMTQISGFAISDNLVISPNSLIPISSTATSLFSFMFNIERGRPMRLF